MIRTETVCYAAARRCLDLCRGAPAVAAVALLCRALAYRARARAARAERLARAARLAARGPRAPVLVRWTDPESPFMEQANIAIRSAGWIPLRKRLALTSDPSGSAKPSRSKATP